MSKKHNIQKHKIAILLSMLTDELNDVKADGSEAIKIKKLASELLEILEPVLDNLYTLKGVSKTTYFQTIENKFDTILRHEYKLINE